MKAVVGVAIGAGLVAVSGSLGWWFAEQTRPREAYLLTYVKPGGMRGVSAELLSGDPTHFTVPATRYASFIASKCRLERWTMSTNANDTDVPEQAVVRLPEDGLSNRQFNCLSGFVKPGYVTLTRTTY